jgi:putative FmdB family regulatory protein
MPIYEYVCGGCERRFERLVRRFDEAVTCPSCASAAVEKQLSVFAVGSVSSGPAFAGCGAGPCASPDAGCGSGPCGGGACSLN